MRTRQCRWWNLFITAFAACAFADDFPGAKTYPAHLLSAPPVIDGRLNDVVWSNIPAGRGFGRFGKEYVKESAERETSFRMGVREDILYIGVECKDPQPLQISAVDTYKEGYVLDDAIELFLLPEGESDYLQFLANAKGARWFKSRGQTNQQDLPVPDEWKVKTGIGNAGWIMEMALPLALLGDGYKPGSPVKFNICRNYPRDANSYWCWAKAEEGGYADVFRFDRIVFVPSEGPDDVAQAEKELNEGHNPTLFEKLKEFTANDEAFGRLAARFPHAPELPELEKFRRELAARLNDAPETERRAMYDKMTALLNVVSVPRFDLKLKVEGRDVKDVKVWINAEEAELKNGVYMPAVFPREGLITLGIKATASGSAPGLKAAVEGVPEAADRWLASAAPASGWDAGEFDDSAWKAVTRDPSGFIWNAADKGVLFLRQVLVWNQTWRGSYCMFHPAVAGGWGFSPGTAEFIFGSIYNPIGQTARTYKVLLDLPSDFKLLDMGKSMLVCDHTPEQVERSPVQRDGKTYTRHTMVFNPGRFASRNPRDVFEMVLPIVYTGNAPAGTTGNFYYRRAINENITETWVAFPYRVFPPVNGRMPRRVKYSFYYPIVHEMSNEALKALIDGSAKAGCNYWTIYPGMEKWPHMEHLNANKIRLCMHYSNYPIWGNCFFDSRGALYRLMKENPRLQARMFNGNEPEKPMGFFCPSQAAGPMNAEFKAAIQSDYKTLLFRDVPAEAMFLNWEREPWGGTPEQKASLTGVQQCICFCELCKAGFRKFAGLPDGTPLLDENIFRDHYSSWRRYVYALDAKVHESVIAVLKSMGKRTWLYSWANHFGYWKASAGIQDELFVGSPAGYDGPTSQPGMDSTAKYLRGLNPDAPMTGQRFVFFRITYAGKAGGWGSWRGAGALEQGGSVVPENWKIQVLRISAAFNAGMDFQAPQELAGGIKYYIGEATRLVADYEDIFYEGRRCDGKVASDDISYPDALAIAKGRERIVLLFNETSNEPKTVTIRNLDLENGQKALLYYQNKTVENPAEMTVTIPPKDVLAICIK